MARGLHSLRVKNFGILGDVQVELGRLNVLVGPNGSGKTTLLEVIGFLGGAARSNLADALAERGGWSRVRTRSAESTEAIEIEVAATVTAHSHPNALDEYHLSFRPIPLRSPAQQPSLFRSGFVQEESFRFKRLRGQGRRITLKGGKLSVRLA